jgi:phospholipase/carboxylesterase
MNPHALAPLRYHGAPLGDARLAVINLHGRELGAESAVELAARLALPGIIHVIPGAAERTWYPASFLAPLATNQPRLDEALARVGDLVRELALPIVLLGFSQGACLALEYLVRHGGVAGAVAFTGGLIGPPGTTWSSTAIAGTPVLLTTSDVDTWVPLARVQDTATTLTASGATVDLHVLAGRAHLVDDREIAAARAFLTHCAG